MRFSSFFALATSFSLSLSQNVVLPTPNGTYGVDTQVFALTDVSRFDPFAPTKQHRRILVSAFYPTGPIEKCQQYLASYMPPGTAALYDTDLASAGIPNGTFESFKLPLCKSSNPSAWKHKPTYPVALFSPGLGTSRLLYSAMAQALSSRGYIVITIDHPYDAPVVEFPDGSLVLGANFTTLDEIAFDVTVRAADVAFLVRKLHSWTKAKQNPLQKACAGPDMESITMFGHSLGGATTASAMFDVPSIRGGVNLDGTLFGPVVKSGLERPFMIFGHEGMNRSTDDTWASIWPHLTGPRIELELLKSQHLTFSDLPLLAELLGIAEAPGIVEYLGALEGKRAINIITAYVDAFFQFVNGHKPADRLKHNVPKYPEVVVGNSRLTSA